MTRAEKIKRIKKQCDELWSKCVRVRDGACILCGKHEGLAAHHWIHSRARSLAHRHDVRNGVTLCFACHIYKVHTDATAATMEELTKAALNRGIVTENELKEIENDNSLAKYSLEDYEHIKTYLQDYLERLDPNFYAVGGTN